MARQGSNPRGVQSDQSELPDRRLPAQREHRPHAVARLHLSRPPHRELSGSRTQQFAAGVPLARSRQDVQAAVDHSGPARPRHPRSVLLRRGQAAVHQGDHPAAGLCAARSGRRLDHGPDAFRRRPQVVADPCDRAAGVGVLARGQARRGVLLDGVCGRRPEDRPVSLAATGSTGHPVLRSMASRPTRRWRQSSHSRRRASACLR